MDQANLAWFICKECYRAYTCLQKFKSHLIQFHNYDPYSQKEKESSLTSLDDDNGSKGEKGVRVLPAAAQQCDLRKTQKKVQCDKEVSTEVFQSDDGPEKSDLFELKLEDKKRPWNKERRDHDIELKGTVQGSKKIIHSQLTRPADDNNSLLRTKMAHSKTTMTKGQDFSEDKAAEFKTVPKKVKTEYEYEIPISIPPVEVESEAKLHNQNCDVKKVGGPKPKPASKKTFDDFEQIRKVYMCSICKKCFPVKKLFKEHKKIHKKC